MVRSRSAVRIRPTAPIFAGLAERSIAPDCKSGALVATEVQILHPAPDFSLQPIGLM